MDADDFVPPSDSDESVNAEVIQSDALDEGNSSSSSNERFTIEQLITEVVYDNNSDYGNSANSSENEVTDDEETNVPANDFTEDVRPIKNYDGDSEILEDYQDDWQWVLGEDIAPPVTPFTSSRCLLIDPQNGKPEVFFNALFKPNQFDFIANQTNLYVSQKKEKQGKVIHFISTCLS